MEILFATTNPAKVKTYKEKLEKRGIKVLTLKDMNIDINVEETGNTAIENASIKAKTYGDIARKITIGIDTNLFFEEVQNEKQPGTYVRRVNGKTLSDEEMISYYKNLAKEYGGKITAKWVDGVAIYNGKEITTCTFERSEFYLVDSESKKRHIGYPLDSITIIPEFNKYLTDLTDEEIEIREKMKKDNSTESIVNTIYDVLNKM